MKSLDIDGDGELETLVHATNRAIGDEAKLFYSDDEIARNVSEEGLMFTELIGVYDILAIFDGGITAYNLNIAIYEDFDILVRNTEDFLILYDIDEDDTYEIVTYTNGSNLAELSAN